MHIKPARKDKLGGLAARPHIFSLTRLESFLLVGRWRLGKKVRLNPCACDEQRAQNNNEQWKTTPETRSEPKVWGHDKWCPEGNGGERDLPAHGELTSRSVLPATWWGQHWYKSQQHPHSIPGLAMLCLTPSSAAHSPWRGKRTLSEAFISSNAQNAHLRSQSGTHKQIRALVYTNHFLLVSVF